MIQLMVGGRLSAAQLAPKADRTVVAACGYGLTGHDLEVTLPVIPVPDVAAINADDDRILLDLPLPSIGGSVIDAAQAPITKTVPCRAATLCRWRRIVQALAVLPIDRTSFSSWAVRSKNERGPSGLQVEQLRSGVLGEQLAQRAESLAGRSLTAAAVKSWTVQRDSTKNGTELDPVRSFAQLSATAAVAAPMSGQKTRHLGSDHALLDAGQHGLPR
jgi:hypothetical protein